MIRLIRVIGVVLILVMFFSASISAIEVKALNAMYPFNTLTTSGQRVIPSNG